MKRIGALMAGRDWRPAAALAAGAALPLAFAPFGLWPLALLAPALLFLLWEGQTEGRAALIGLAFGLGQFGVGVSWVHHSIHYFGGLPMPPAVALTALLVLFLALFPAALGWVSRRWPPTTAAGRLLGLLPASWVLAEWVRGWLFTGFPWLHLGYSQIDAPLAGLAPLAGVYGVSWGTALTAGGVALLVVERERAVRWLAVPAAAWLIGVAAGTIQWSTPAGTPISVALLQGNVAQQLKWQPGERQEQLALYHRMTRTQLGADLIVWPETAVPAFLHQERVFLDALQREAAAAGSEVIVGAPVREDQGSAYYNALVNLAEPERHYRKRHLVPFGEYLPLRWALGELLRILRIPMADFHAGNGDTLQLRGAGVAIGASICYEAAFGEELIEALPAARVLLNVSNDAWFGDSLAPHQHLEIARMRALETGRWLLRATNSGISALIAPDGRVTLRTPQFQATTLRAEVPPLSGATPYVIMGNLPVVGMLLLGLALYAARRRRVSA